MIKIFLLLLIFIKLSLGNTYAENEYKILLKIDKKIITNFDLQKEKRYLTALNPQLLQLSGVQIERISKESLIREIVKENEIIKFYEIDYDSPQFTNLTKNIYNKLNINTEDEFTDYLLKFNLELKDIVRKLAIEATWNQLIFDRYRGLVNINEKEIKKNLNMELKNPNTQKKFFISEILFDAKNKDEYNEKYNSIIKTIKEKGFKTAASIYSISDSAKNGGEIGWTSKNEISNEIYKELFKLKVNESSNTIKIPSGFLMIYLNKIKEENIKINKQDEFNKRVSAERNQQLNQFSIIYYKKIEKQSFIDAK